MGRRQKPVRCPKCEDTDVSHFSKASNRASGKQLYCKTCHYNMKRGEYVMVRYKKSPEQITELLASQNGTCAICQQPTTKKLDIDHDHACCPGVMTCGKCVRGLLCKNCNQLLGHAKDDVICLKRAIEYLSKFKKSFKVGV